MKTQLKNYALSVFLVLALVLAIIITNFFVYYTVVCNSEILQSKDIYGRVSFARVASVHHRKKRIMNLSEDRNRDIAQMLEEIALLEGLITRSG